MTIHGRLTVRTRTHFSGIHLRAASLFAGLAVEAESRSAPREEVLFEHRSYVLATIFHSAAFLEACINEVFSDASEANGGCIKELDPGERQLLAEMWDQDVPRTAQYSIVRKYEIALSLLRRPKMDRSRNPYQDAKVLTDLRNAFIHYVPEWHLHADHTEEDQRLAHRFERALRSRFAPNPLTGAGNPFYPDKLLSAGCAGWAVETAVAFANEFFARLNIERPYEHVLNSIGGPRP